MNWQKRARLGFAIVGIAGAIGVYAVMGERATPAPFAVPARVDPKAVIESQGNILQQVRGTRQDYLIEAEQQLTYEGGATRLKGVKVTIRNRGGRDYVISAQEAQATERQQELRLGGDVKLAASDGFALSTSEAFFTENDGNVRAPAAFSFGRGRMSGTGNGMVYDKNADVLSITGEADVTLTDEGDNVRSQFTAGSGVFARPDHRLDLTGRVHALHNDETFDAEQVTAHLTEDDSRITALALRGGARVAGSGQGLDAMSADGIDLTYAEDGQTIERVVLMGNGHVAIAGTEGSSGREIAGNVLDLRLDPDGSISTVTGRDGVQLDLAGTSAATARRVKAQTLEGTGGEGRGLQAAQFRGDVEYREEPGKDAAGRVARSSALDVKMVDDGVESAAFSGNVRFDEQGMQAAGGQALYAPAQGTLRLTAGSEKRMPTVADEQLTVEAATIDVTLEGRRMSAGGGVKTTLRPRQQQSGRAARGGGESSKLPGLLKQEQPANVSAASLVYEGAAGNAIYSGHAALLQGDTAIRADVITIDQATGDLLATGDARSTITLDTGTSIGRAAKISYTDAKRLIGYEGVSAPPAVKSAPAQVSLPDSQGDLRAMRIEFVLATAGSTIDRLEAYTDVNLKVDTRTATGARLTYFADEQRYLMTGTGASPVKVVENCRQTSGRTLIFFKATDRIVVDGNEEIRTQTTGGTCSPPSPRSR